jgi:ubiquinone/menaquinone biosynthesis C-methylase UbiE
VKKVDYDERQHSVYVAGRQMPPDALQTWMDAFAGHLPESRPLAWLDLGSGSGRMAPSLASAFGGPVHGVEPSDKMRAQALGHARHPAVTYAAGSAEHIPLPDASCDAALLFYVWHHVSDHEAAALELRRVVKPGGRLFVNTNFSDLMPYVWWFRVVPEWWEIVDKQQFGPRTKVESDFVGAGWTLVSHDEVTWRRSASLAADFDKLKLRALSVFELMSEEIIQAGFAKIERALPTLDPGPQSETSQLLVFER